MSKLLNGNKKELLIIGCGGHAKVITDIAKDVGYEKIFYQDNNLKKNKFLDSKVFHQEFKNFDKNFFVALGDNYLREKVTTNFKLKNPNSVAVSLIHPSSYISKSCSIGNGTVIMPLCIVNSHTKVGEGVIINNRSSIDHDNVLMNYSSIAPGVTTGGNVKLGERSAISIGATIKHKIEIGNDTVIGASSFVNINIDSNIVAYGSPVRIIKERKRGEQYL